MSGETVAKQVVQSVNVVIYLQQYRNGQWVNIWSDKTTKFGSINATINKSVIAPRGYYYRLVGVHGVNHNGVYEMDISYHWNFLCPLNTPIDSPKLTVLFGDISTHNK
ncbi:MAG: hypothetical protein KGZ63_09315 [Clostridiales bacterium]|nr:hypothetical protein [Clostridiales bacterium]